MSDNPYTAPQSEAAQSSGKQVAAKQRSRLLLASVIASPLVLVALFWGLFDPRTWNAPEENALRERIELSVLTSTGPLAGKFYYSRDKLSQTLTTSGVLWAAWVSLVVFTRLRRVPLWVYLVGSCLWCFAGLSVASMVIT